MENIKYNNRQRHTCGRGAKTIAIAGNLLDFLFFSNTRTILFFFEQKVRGRVNFEPARACRATRESIS